MADRRSFLMQVAGGLPLLQAKAHRSTNQKPVPAIWDLHGHIGGFRGATPEEWMEDLVKFADRMGVERFVVSMSTPTYFDPTPEQLRQQNDDVLRALRRAPRRAFGFVYLNPNQLEASLQELDRCVRGGPMVGVKLWCAKRCNAPELDPIVEHARVLKALVFQHTYLKNAGNLPGESTPFDLAELARRHPKANLVLGHTGADWERGIRAVRGLGNVYVDLAGFDPEAGVTEMAVRELGAGHVLYGSDIPGRGFASQLAKVMGAELPQDAKALILGANLRRLLTPIAEPKGLL
jgi:predicted TIM-barrel fold metal-dependent hydrolase